MEAEVIGAKIFDNPELNIDYTKGAGKKLYFYLVKFQ